MYKRNLRAVLQDTAKRGGWFAAAVVMLGSSGAAAFTGAFSGIASADALNPLTDRSLRLTSSAPGYQDTDGSGNSESNPNAGGITYALPGSGANGKKTGETFTFKVSTNSSSSGTNQPLKAFTFQYCTSAAGTCLAPGNNTGGAWNGTAFTTPRGADTTTTSDLNVNHPSAVCGTDFVIKHDGVTEPCGTAPNNWTLTASNKETASLSTLTGKNNYITLANPGSTLAPESYDQLEITFLASSTNYITNPGSKTNPFFVRINSYFDEDADMANVVDGGVTVANIMNDSIWIQTKVLESMSFSVGKTDPNLLTQAHGPCDAIEDTSPLKMGAPDSEYSLSAQQAFDAESYWRLATNSSAGASVYYSGVTLSNTVGDQIDPIGTAAAKSKVGKEQFGLALNTNYSDLSATYTTSGFDAAVSADASGMTFLPDLDILNAAPGYETGAGTITDNGTAEFAFDPNANSTAALLASGTNGVLKCSTGRMRYIANIAGYTPAGIYTTKINYLAAPQY